MQVRLPEDKVAEIRSLAASLQDRRVVSARSLMTFLGKVTFASDGVELVRLHSRELRTALRTVYKRPRDICRTVHLHREALHSLDFRKELTPSPLPLRRPQAEIIMATDASSSGWGGSLHALSASGRWSRGQRSRHINSLELMAVEYSLRSFEDRVEGRTVYVQIDNRTAVANLAKEGGTKSVLLSRLACRILLWCQRHRVTLIPVYLRGIGNTIADALSRGKGTQWHLSPTMVDRIFQRYGTPRSTSLPPGRHLSYPSTWLSSGGTIKPWQWTLSVRCGTSTWCTPSPQRLSRRWPTSSGAPRPECSVDASPDGTPVRHASPDSHVSEAPDQHSDQLPGGQRGGSEADCMANMRSATGLNLPSATFALLENSWRPSTRRQWSRFCQNESMDPFSICVESMLGYPVPLW